MKQFKKNNFILFIANDQIITTHTKKEYKEVYFFVINDTLNAFANNFFFVRIYINILKNKEIYFIRIIFFYTKLVFTNGNFFKQIKNNVKLVR